MSVPLIDKNKTEEEIKKEISNIDSEDETDEVFFEDE